MSRAGMSQQKLEKRYVAAMSTFAVENIPDTDPTTLTKFLELVNVAGSHDWLSAQQLCDKMQIMIKYVPDTDVESLLILAELLNVSVPTELKCGKYSKI